MLFKLSLRASIACGTRAARLSLLFQRCLQAWIDGLVCFFVPYLTVSTLGARSTYGVFAVGKTVFICMLGVVNLELAIVARFWTRYFGIAVVVSWLIGYPFLLLYSAFEEWFGSVDMSAYAMGRNLFTTWWFWIACLTVYLITGGLRYIERSTMLLFRPDVTFVRAELEEAARIDDALIANRRARHAGGASGGASNGNSLVPSMRQSSKEPRSVASQPEANGKSPLPAAARERVGGNSLGNGAASQHRQASEYASAASSARREGADEADGASEHEAFVTPRAATSASTTPRAGHSIELTPVEQAHAQPAAAPAAPAHGDAQVGSASAASCELS